MLLERGSVLARLTVLAVSIGCAAAPSGGSGTSPSGLLVTDADLAAGDPIEVIIQRKVPGVVVTRTSDGGIGLQIRGAANLGNTETRPPLYVVNGVPLSPGTYGGLQGVNPREIASIRVLKGAETGIYGIDGANGVIVVTTKTGRRP